MFRTTFKRSFSTSDKDFSRIADSLSNMSKTYTKSKSFKNYAFTHPFKAYFKVGSVVFGGVFAANSLYGAFSEDPPVSPYEFPQTFAWMNITKSMYFGLVWPSVPFMLLGEDSRRDLCVLGSTVEKVQTQITDNLENAMENAKAKSQTTSKTTTTINGKQMKEDEIDEIISAIKEAKEEIHSTLKDLFK